MDLTYVEPKHKDQRAHVLHSSPGYCTQAAISFLSPDGLDITIGVSYMYMYVYNCQSLHTGALIKLKVHKFFGLFMTQELAAQNGRKLHPLRQCTFHTSMCVSSFEGYEQYFNHQRAMGAESPPLDYSLVLLGLNVSGDL